MEKIENNKILVLGMVLVLGILIGYSLSWCISKNRFYGGMYHRMNDGYMMEGMDMDHVMGGMTMSLQNKTGKALEKAFIDEMIVHHQGAIDMANILLKGTTRAELIKLSNDIISAQTKEIEMMKKWKGEWFSN